MPNPEMIPRDVEDILHDTVAKASGFITDAVHGKKESLIKEKMVYSLPPLQSQHPEVLLIVDNDAGVKPAMHRDHHDLWLGWVGEGTTTPMEFTSGGVLVPMNELVRDGEVVRGEFVGERIVTVEPRKLPKCILKHEETLLIPKNTPYAHEPYAIHGIAASAVIRYEQPS